MESNAILSIEYLATALIVVLAPGTGVIYTLSIGVLHGVRASIAAAAGCTIGILPHLLASILGLAALLHASAVAFQIVKVLGIAYLLYLAWEMWRGSGSLSLNEGNGKTGPRAEQRPTSLRTIAIRGAAINILNPKLALFFMAFLPQFIPASAPDSLFRFAALSAVFMTLTFVVFVGYGAIAGAIRNQVLSSSRATKWVQRAFAAAFAGFAARLALAER